MSTIEIVAIAVGVFFVIGVVAGAITVVAMSVLRPEWKNRKAARGWARIEPPAPGYGVNEELGDDLPRWPDATLAGQPTARLGALAGAAPGRWPAGTGESLRAAGIPRPGRAARQAPGETLLGTGSKA